MSSDMKTAWERINEAMRPYEYGIMPIEIPEHEWNAEAHAFYFVCKELDELRRRNADLERRVREMATGKR